ncbi:hypothetical protein [Acinetobacter ursingii]|uniref:hypothetical protein n=1 Tax=Acinetobacter ursingii TaxID=108980 RepID=UPI003AF4131A
MKKIFILLSGIITSSCINAQEFDFRGAILGMTLSDFKNLPPINGKLLRDGTTVSCTEKQDNLECMRAGDDPFNQTFGFTTINYVFHKDASNQPKLYIIMLMSDNRNAAASLAGLTEKWGKGSQATSHATNGLGIEIKTIEVKWNKPNSEIILESPCGSVKYFCMTYQHKGIYKQISDGNKKENNF